MSGHPRAFIFTLIILLVSFSGTFPTYASTRINTNVSRVEVNDQSEQSQKSALKAALEQTLIKLTGNPEIATNEAARFQLRNAGQLLL